MKRVICLAVLAASFVGCGDGGRDSLSLSDLEETEEELADLLADEGVTVDDFRRRAAWLSDLPEEDRAEQVRVDFKFALSRMGVSSPVADWSNEQIIDFARKACEVMEGAGDLDEYAISMGAIALKYDLYTYEDQVAAGTLAGAAANGWCFDEAERLGFIDGALGGKAG